MTQPDPPARSVWQLLDGTGGHLACGADVDELLEQAADGHRRRLTGHQRDCPGCQAALAEFSRLWGPLQRLAAEPVAVPALLKAAVTRQIRKLVSDTWYTLHPSDTGALRVAAHVVARIARHAARTVPGVAVAFGRSTRGKNADLAERATLRHRHPHAAVGVLGLTAVIDLAIAVQYGQQADEIAQAVQQRALAEVRAQAGLQDITVNITIDDVIT